MRHVEVNAVLRHTRAEDAFDVLVRFERYPQLVDVVKSVTVVDRPADGLVVTAWEVYFRNGILAWTESDSLRRDELCFSFEQVEGDFDEFSGVWVLRQDGEHVTLGFSADFDFGVPSLASIIDPVAERVLRETIQLILRGLFDAVEFPDGELAVSAGHAPAGAR